MIRFQMDVSFADVTARTIEGVVVPYGEVGRVAGVQYRFLPGSIAAARSRTPLLLDHDRSRPIGVLAQLTEAEEGALGRFLIDTTPAGDEALAQAASGSRGALSVGCEVVAADVAADGTLDVTAGQIHEVSLLALGAFAGATVTRVAATADAEPEPEPDDDDDDDDAEPGADLDQLPLDGDDAGDDAGESEETTMEATETAPVILAQRDRARPLDALGAGELVTTMVLAQQGDSEARRFLEAALTESISTDLTGLLPPQYERSVLGERIVARPLYETFRGRALPGVGLAVNKPKWTTPPNGAWAASVDADATSTKVVVGSQSATVERWDWAGAIPWVVVQRSDPSVIDEVYSAAVLDFYADVETKIATELDASAAAGTATDLGAGIAEFYGITGQAPDAVLVAPDVWGAMADTGALSEPVASGGVSVGETLRSSFAGLPVIASANLAPGSTYLATRRALDVRITDPVRLTANAIGALNVELAVVGEGLFDTDYATELLQLAAGGAALASRSARK